MLACWFLPRVIDDAGSHYLLPKYGFPAPLHWCVHCHQRGSDLSPHHLALSLIPLRPSTIHDEHNNMSVYIIQNS